MEELIQLGEAAAHRAHSQHERLILDHSLLCLGTLVSLREVPGLTVLPVDGGQIVSPTNLHAHLFGHGRQTRWGVALGHVALAQHSLYRAALTAVLRDLHIELLFQLPDDLLDVHVAFRLLPLGSEHGL